MTIRKTDVEILRIEEYKKNRELVYLEEGTPAFCLYTKEIRTFGLKEGAVLTDEQYQEIISVLCKRARERSLYLLEDMARTEQQVRRKLREGYYPEEAVDFAISYCKDKHYIDDDDYTRRFIQSRSDKLSKRMIQSKLFEKGIPKEIIEAAFEESDIFEEEAIRKIVAKKNVDTELLDAAGRQKLIRSLLGKGFSYDAIKNVISASE
ncbi:MAG: recombination regulator RecX [Lachnospiraceae bacterium]|nr:recombination regulator RecX [Lachnospiraceae bacterium]